MLKVLERDYEQSLQSAVDEFPYCHILLRSYDIGDAYYLLAVSDSIESDKEFNGYVARQCGNGILCFAGIYKEEDDGYELERCIYEEGELEYLNSEQFQKDIVNTNYKEPPEEFYEVLRQLMDQF